MSSFTNGGDAIQNEFGGGCPDKGLGCARVGGDVVVDGGDELIDAFAHPAADALPGHLGKPAFELVEPGTAGGRQVQVVARTFPQPGGDLGSFGRGVVVQHHGARLLRRVEVESDAVADLLHEEGVGGELAVFLQVRLESAGAPTERSEIAKGRSLCPQGSAGGRWPMRTLACWLSPLASAMVRVLQGVACWGVVSSVRVMTASTFAFVSLRGWPERGAAPSAPSRPSKKRWHHLPTV